MKVEETRRYLAVYGAHVANEVASHLAENMGLPTEPRMRHIVEEAHAIAALAERCQPSFEDV
jgi:hypothetical protein